MQLGQQGSWLVLEEAVLEIAEHKAACGYAGVSAESVGMQENEGTFSFELHSNTHYMILSEHHERAFAQA